LIASAIMAGLQPFVVVLWWLWSEESAVRSDQSWRCRDNLLCGYLFIFMSEWGRTPAFRCMQPKLSFPAQSTLQNQVNRGRCAEPEGVL